MVPERELTGILRELLDTDPDRGIVLLTLDRRVLYSNPAARHHLMDGSPRGSDPLLPGSLQPVLDAFGARMQGNRGPVSTEAYYPSDDDRRVRVTLEAYWRDSVPHVVLRAQPLMPWPEPTVRRLQQRFGLTVREAQVAAGVSKGHTNAEVAEQLGIVEKTVKNVLMSVFTKCKVRNRVELALRAYDAPVPTLPQRV
jgi:DNA-binding CsgD family transcriptional regulator